MGKILLGLLDKPASGERDQLRYGSLNRIRNHGECGAHRQIRTLHRTTDDQGWKFLASREGMIVACPPIVPPFKRSWTRFRTLRFRWPFLFLQNWVSGKSLIPKPRPSWIRPAR